MAFIHKYTQIYPGNPEGKKPAFLELLLLSLFLSLHYIECLQYNISYLPTSETPIPNPELENHGQKNHWPKIAKNNPKNFSRGPAGTHAPQPRGLVPLRAPSFGDQPLNPY